MLGFATEQLIGRLVWLGLLHATWLALAVSSSLAFGFRLAPRLSRGQRHTALLLGLAIVALGPVAITARQHFMSLETLGDHQIGRMVVVQPDRLTNADEPVESRVSPRPFVPSRWRFFDQARELLERASKLARAARPWGLIAWSVAVLLLGSWLALGGFGVRRLLRQSRHAPEAIQARARVLAGRLGLTVVPTVRIHPNLLEPCLSGLARPAVLLPEGWLSRASEPELDAVLAHELAHAKRLDPLVNLAQRLMEAALFFHPGVRWLSTRLRSERELCTDALAVRATGDPLGLALALESVARFRLESDRYWTSKLPGLALGGDGLPLFSRIQELIGMTPTRPRLSVWTFAAIPLAAILGLLATSVGSAQDAPTKPAEAPSTVPIPRARPAIPVEEPQISYEVRLVSIQDETLKRLKLERLEQFKKGPNGEEGWIADAKQLRSLLESAQADPTSNVLQAPKLTAFEGAHAVIRNYDRDDPDEKKVVEVGDNKRTLEPGEYRVDLSGKIQPDSIELTLLFQLGVPGFKPGEAAARGVKTTNLIPEDSSLVVSLGRQERKLETETLIEETLVVVTPRRIIPEAEEERIGGKGSKARRLSRVIGAFW